MWRRLALDLVRMGAGSALSVGPVRRAHRRIRGQRGRRVALFYYHRVYTEDVQPLYQLGIHRDLFRSQISDIARTHRFVPLLEAIEAAESGAEGPDLASLTFDDGYRDNYTEAFPILRQLGIPATIFVVAGALESGSLLWYDEVKIVCERAAGARLALPSRLGGGAIEIADLAHRRRAFDEIMKRLRMLDDGARREAVADLVGRSGVSTNEFRERDALLTWEQARVMESGGIRFGSHTMTHPLLPRVSDPSILREELAGSRELLKARLADPLPVLAYPEGRWSEDAGRAAAENGYRYAVTTLPGDLVAGFDPLRLPRRGLGPMSSTFLKRRHTRAILVAESEGWLDILRRRRTGRRVTYTATLESNKAVARSFDSRANAYQSDRERDPAFEGEVGEIFRLLPAEQGVAIEVGCGVGLASLRLASSGWSVVATDISLAMLKHARANADAAGAALLGIVRCDVKRLPFRSGAVHAVLCQGMLEYAGGVEAATAEMSRILQDGGHAVATIPSRLSPASWTASVLGAISRAGSERGETQERVHWKHLFPWSFDHIARDAGLERREGLPQTFTFIPAEFCPRGWLVFNNRIVSALPRSWIFRWWGSQYIARYDKPR